MIRKSLNASQLQQEVQRRLQRLLDAAEDGAKIRVPRPQPQPPDKTGCNWTMKHFGNAAGFERDIEAVLRAVRAEYNLSTEAGAGAKRAAADPFADFPGH